MGSRIRFIQTEPANGWRGARTYQVEEVTPGGVKAHGLVVRMVTNRYSTPHGPVWWFPTRFDGEALTHGYRTRREATEALLTSRAQVS